MTQVLLQGDNIISKSIIYSAARFSDSKTYTLIPQKNPRDTSLPKTSYCLSIGKHNIDFEGNNFTLNYSNEQESKEVDCQLKKYQEIIIEGESKELIDGFIQECKKIYEKEIKFLEVTSKKITCFVYDVDYWCKLNKVNKRNIDTLCFDKDEHLELLDEIKLFLSKDTETEYHSFGIPYKLNILLEGYPGTGKTSLIYAVASHFGMDIAMISFDAKMNDVALMRAIKRAPENSIIVFEDIDVLFKERKDNDTCTGISFSGLLNCLDGICSAHGQIIFMTTNFCCNLDIALKRPGRVDKCMHFDYATKNQKKLIFKNSFQIYQMFKRNF